MVRRWRYVLIYEINALTLVAADIRMTNVPDIRVDYRHETLLAELAFIQT